MRISTLIPLLSLLCLLSCFGSVRSDRVLSLNPARGVISDSSASIPTLADHNGNHTDLAVFSLVYSFFNSSGHDGFAPISLVKYSESNGVTTFYGAALYSVNEEGPNIATGTLFTLTATKISNSIQYKYDFSLIHRFASSNDSLIMNPQVELAVDHADGKIYGISQGYLEMREENGQEWEERAEFDGLFSIDPKNNNEFKQIQTREQIMQGLNATRVSTK